MNRLDVAEERIDELEGMSVETSRKCKEKRERKRTEYASTTGQLQMLYTYHRNTGKIRKREEQKKYLKQ